MLRITVHDTPEVITFRLEGAVAGPSLRELERCWEAALACKRGAVTRVDLGEVTFIDDAGKACLARLHRQGAEFIATDCLTKAVVAEIARPPSSRVRAPTARGTTSGTDLQ